jgi:hypothetical protein
MWPLPLIVPALRFDARRSANMPSAPLWKRPHHDECQFVYHALYGYLVRLIVSATSRSAACTRARTLPQMVCCQSGRESM